MPGAGAGPESPHNRLHQLSAAAPEQEARQMSPEPGAPERTAGPSTSRWRQTPTGEVAKHMGSSEAAHGESGRRAEGQNKMGEIDG